ncbi:MAG: class I SAM-dependent methyltransferase [Thermodesulfobacteriota bacterium]
MSVRKSGSLLRNRIATYLSDFFQDRLPPQLEARVISDAGRFWAASDGDPDLRDLSHWAGEGRWTDREAWERIGRAHWRMFERLCLLAECEKRVESMAEWGPGGGANAIQFCRAIPRFYGIDISRANLEECERQVRAHGLHGFTPVLIPGDRPEECEQAIGEPVEFFLSTAVYQHFPSRNYGIRVTRIAHRLLSDNGIALIQIRYDDGDRAHRSKTRNYADQALSFTTWTIEHFWAEADDCGFEPLAISLDTDARYAYYFLKKRIFR